VTPDCIAITDAPERAVPSLIRVTVPEIVPVPRTVKLAPLLAVPPTVTTTGPDVAPAGTLAITRVEVQVEAVAETPLKVTVLVPCVEPKAVPYNEIESPTAPEVGDRLVMLGGTRTMKVTPLLGTPLTATTTFPVTAPAGTGVTIDVALQLVGVAVVPLNVTVLVP